MQDFLERADARPALVAFCAKHRADAAVVIGMSFEGEAGEAPGTLKRDLCVYSTGAAEQPAKSVGNWNYCRRSHFSRPDFDLVRSDFS